MYYRNSQAAIVVYDIQNRDSFHRAKCWVTTLRSQVISEVWQIQVQNLVHALTRQMNNFQCVSIFH